MTTSSAVSPKRWTALIVLSIVQLVLVLDDGVVNVALPTMRQDLGLGPSSLAWVNNSYALVFGALLLAGGWLADRHGRRRIFMIGTALFGLASLACAFAPSAELFLGARVVEGGGAALASPAALALVVAAFPSGEERNKALGTWGIAAGVGGVLGMTASGLLIGLTSWHWAFLINVPLAAFVLVAVPRLVQESRGDSTRRADWWGALTITGALGLAVYGLLAAATDGDVAGRLGVFAVAAALLAVFVVLQVKQRDTMIPHGFFAVRNRATGFVVSFLMAGCFMAVFFALSLHLQDALHWSPLLTGLALTVQPVVSFVVFPVAAGSTFKYGVHVVLPVGLGICAAGLLWLGRIDGPASYAVDVLPALILLGIGTALAFVAATAAGFGGAEEVAGLASGVIDASQQVGMAVGLAALVSIDAWAATDTAAAFGEHIGRGFLVGGVLLAVTALVAARAMEKVEFGPPPNVEAAGPDGRATSQH